jgi:outer membrane protein OmpA-like peptidoglycan-associated protein
MARPMLGDLELEQVQRVGTSEDQVVTRHPVPGLEGDFQQVLGRRGAQLGLTGVLTAADTLRHLAALRTRFHAGEPVGFVSDISTATGVEQVLIERMDVRELAGRPSAFEYRFALREHIEAEAIVTEEVVIPPPPPPDVETGKLSVTVVVEGDPAFDMDRVTVTVRGKQAKELADLHRVLTKRIRPDSWFEEQFPAGDYTVDALVDDTATPTGQREVLTGSATVQVQDGQVGAVTVVLRRGAKVGTVFLIHFRFDKAFVEPCMRHVLQQVAAYAAKHPDERLLVNGHTDLTGSDAYNQALSERRARATYAMLTFGSEPQKSIAEWDELRRARPTGEITTVKDTWGTREIQHMLQDLGRYQGNVGVTSGEDAVLTDAAIRKFQHDNGLTDDGVVGDDTWPVLIEAYLAHESINLPTAQLLPNRDAKGCDSGPLRWIGCGEQDPVKNVLTAWRPNRRTELMFVHEDEMPCPVPKPLTLDLVPAGAGGGGWCLDDGNATTVDCFVVPIDPAPKKPDKHQWQRKPAEPGTFAVTGTITFEDGTPFDGTYVLTASDGEYMDGEITAAAPTAKPPVLAGTPVPGRTQPADGSFSAAAQAIHKGPGTYSVEVQGPFLIRARSQSLADAMGNAVCFRLDGSKPADLVVVDRAIAGIQPSVTAPDAVVVKKPHTNPARQPVVLRASTAFNGSGTLTRSSDAVRFFDAVAAGNEIAFDGTDNVFTAAQLQAGHTIFAEGARASAAVRDIELRLALTVGTTPGLVATHAMTVVELTLDIGLSRPAAGGAPPVMSAVDKVAPGRPLQAQDAGRNAERAMLLIRPPVPAGFTGDLALNPLNGRVQLLATEVPAAGDVPLVPPRVIPAGTIPAAGLQLFVEGVTPSLAATDTGVQLGLNGIEPDGDRVEATVLQLDVCLDPAVAAPAVTAVQVGLWDGAFDPVTGLLRNGATAATSFVDLDPRNFHFRVRDPRNAGEITIGWRSEFDDGTDDDARRPPRSDRLSLTESAAGSGIFVSRAVMLVADQLDRDQPVESGLPAAHPDTGLRAFGDSNHRLRRILVDATHQLTSQVVGEYTVLPGVNPFRVRTPVFERNPEDRRRIRVHLVNVRRSAGGIDTLTAARRRDVEANIHAAYATCGVFAEVDRIDIDPPATASSWVATYPGDPLAADPSVEEFTFPGGVNLIPSTSETDIIDLLRVRPGFDAGGIHLVAVRRLYANPVPAPPGPGLADSGGGEAFPDSWTAAGSNARGFAFIAIDNIIHTFAEPHEMTHITTDLRNVAGGHFYLGAAGANTLGPIDGKNLMHPTPNINGTTSMSKRLWDNAFANAGQGFIVPAQITAIRASRFVLPY